MRLTKKNDMMGSWTQTGDEYMPAHNIKHKECVNKLGHLEDIEKELGIDLITYHKLMHMLYCSEENILFVRDGDKIIEVSVLEIDYCKKKIIFHKDKNYNDDYIYGFHQYGKTWAFSKGELL